MTTDPLLTSAEVAALIKVEPNTLSAYKSRGQMPPPDKQYGRTPLWKLSTITAWDMKRPSKLNNLE